MDFNKQTYFGIDLVSYINLNIRTDRRQEIEKEFVRAGIPENLILRWEATRHRQNGAYGCTMSHIALLEFIMKERPDVKTLLVLEDDFNFVDDIELVKKSLDEFSKYPRESWDLALLQYHVREKQDHNELVSKVLFSQGTAAYMVNRDAIPKLLVNFKEGLTRGYALDCYWWHFMRESGKCFFFNKSLGYQRESYSDIIKQVMGDNSRRDSIVDLNEGILNAIKAQVKQ